MGEMDLERLAALVAVVSEGTFDAAARRLNITPSAVSQRIRALEDQVGRVLVTRTKPVRPTPSGTVLVRAARQIQAISDDALRELGTEGAGATVTVPLAVNADSLATWFLPALAPLRDITFDLQREDQDRTAQLLREGLVWAAVTAAAEPVPGCSVERLGTMRYRPMAAPAFAERHFGDRPTPAGLARAPVVVYDRDDRLQERYVQRHGRRRLHGARHYVPSSEAFVRAVGLGLGWGMVPDLQAGAATHDLVDLDPDGEGLGVTLYWAQPLRPAATLARVAAAVRAAAADTLR